MDTTGWDFAPVMSSVKPLVHGADLPHFVPGRPLVNPKYEKIDWIGEYLHNVPGPVAR